MKIRELTFRLAKLEDINQIINLCNECFNENTNIEYAINQFKESANDKNQIYLVGCIKDEIIAHAKITIIPTIYKPMATYAILNHVCVKPELRRKNIATKMLDEIVKICKENNCVCLELWSKNFRKAAHKCYKHYGFKVEDAKFFAKEL